MNKKINVKEHLETRDGKTFQLVRLSNAVEIKLRGSVDHLGVGCFCTKEEIDSVPCDFTVTFTK